MLGFVGLTVTGCASTKSMRPCVVTGLTVINAGSNYESNRLCRKIAGRTDWVYDETGEPIPKEMMIYGCFIPAEHTMVTNGTDSNETHELDHVWEYYCE